MNFIQHNLKTFQFKKTVRIGRLHVVAPCRIKTINKESSYLKEIFYICIETKTRDVKESK